MSVALAIVASIYAVLLVVSSIGKFVQAEFQMATLDAVGFPRERAWTLGSLELAAAVGIVIGLFWWPLAIAAGAGAVLYFVGAVASHLRARNHDVAAPLMMLLLAAAVVTLRILAT